MPKNAAAWAVVRQRRGPDDALGAFLDGQFGIRPAHVGLHPTRTDRTHLDPRALEFVRKDARQGSMPASTTDHPDNDRSCR